MCRHPWVLGLLLSAAGLAVAAPAAGADVAFSQQQNYFLGTSSYGFSGAPTAFAVGDATNDGLADIVAVSSASKAVLLFQGRGNGEFYVVTNNSPLDGATGSPTAVAIGKMHGRTDVAVGLSSANQFLGGLYGNPSGSLVSTAGGAFAMAAGDFNEDGLTDFAMPYPGDSELQIVLQAGSGWQTTRSGSGDANTVPAPAAAYGGLPMTPVVAGVRARARSSAAGQSCSNLPVPTSHNITAPSPTNIAVGDVDGDGHQDLYVSANYGFGGTSDWIAYGDGNGCFPRAATAGGISRFAVLADVTGDGRVELLASQYSCTQAHTTPPDSCDTSIQVYKRVSVDGSSTFTKPYVNAYANNVDYPQQWALADYDGDGHPDIFAVGYQHVTFGTSGFGSIILNQSVGGSWGNWHSKQQIMHDSDGADGPIQAGTADFDRDGYPDVAALNLTSKTVSVMLNRTAATAVAGGAEFAVPKDGDEPAVAPWASAAAPPVRRRARALIVALRCRRGLARSCRGTLAVHRPGAARGGSAVPRRGARLARVRYRLTPGRHRVRVPLTSRLRRDLADRSSGRLVIATRTVQPAGRHPSRNVCLVRVGAR